jgi:hypothetical protein
VDTSCAFYVMHGSRSSPLTCDASAPKNYLDAGDGMATINVIRKRASSVPSKGTVFVNPGRAYFFSSS